MAWFRRKLKGIRTETKEKKILLKVYGIRHPPEI